MRSRSTAYERHSIEDVIGFVDRTFQTIRARRGRGLAASRWAAWGEVGAEVPAALRQRGRAFTRDVRRRVERLEMARGRCGVSSVSVPAGALTICMYCSGSIGVPARAADRLRERG